MDTETRLRPFRLRLDKTLRPPGVAMRDRKPCFLLRLILLGWKVLFIIRPREHKSFCAVFFRGEDREKEPVYQVKNFFHCLSWSCGQVSKLLWTKNFFTIDTAVTV